MEDEPIEIHACVLNTDALCKPRPVPPFHASNMWPVLMVTQRCTDLMPLLSVKVNWPKIAFLKKYMYTVKYWQVCFCWLVTKGEAGKFSKNWDVSLMVKKLERIWSTERSSSVSHIVSKRSAHHARSLKTLNIFIVEERGGNPHPFSSFCSLVLHKYWHMQVLYHVKLQCEKAQ